MEKGLSTLTASSDAKLRQYCTMGLGTAVLVGAVTTMDASVVYTNYNNTVLADTVTTDTDPTFYNLDLNNDGINDISFFIRNEGAGSAGNYAVITAGVTTNAGVQTVNPLGFVGITAAAASSEIYRYPSRLAAGVSVGPTKTFVTVSGTAQSLPGGTLAFGAGFTNSKWAKANRNSGYLGLEFSVAGQLHYAFIQMTVALNTATNARAVTLIGAGYETTANTAITTAPNAVPEPSSLALLAAGGLGGVAAFRNRRKKAAAAKVAAEVA